MVALNIINVFCLLSAFNFERSGAESTDHTARSLATCPNGGILDPTQKFCCLGSCGTCGGAGCDKRPGGVAGCCTSQIEVSCANAGLPCLALPDNNNPPPTNNVCPFGGILDSSGKNCCLNSCGTCGGAGCDTRPGGVAGCCTSQFKASCDGGALPCIITGQAAPNNPPAGGGGCGANGVLNASGEFCCPATCGACGGFGCDKRPGGAGQCCTGSIVNSCNTNNPPCKLEGPGVEEPVPITNCPNNGVVNASGEFCCPAACGACGGFGCDKRPGGAGLCCTGQITNSCNTNNPPCKLGGPIVNEPKPVAGCPNNSVVNASGEFCCPATCGDCGGFGCDKRPGGPGQCCTGSIVTSCNTANPPCKLDAPVVNNPNPPTNPQAPTQCPNNGVMNSSGEFCCPAACGECGGFGCDKRPGGAGQCCTGGIKNECGNVLPCKLVAAVKKPSRPMNCDPKMCKNGGYCVNMNNFSDVIKIPGCECPAGFSGRFCENGP